MSKYNVGDIVSTGLSHSKWNTPIPPGPKRVSQAYLRDGEMVLENIPEDPNENYAVNEADVQPYAPTFKPGDVVEVLIECKDPVFSDKCLAGTKGVVRDPVTYGDGYIRIGTAEYGKTHDGYFVAKPQNLRLVSAAAPKSTSQFKVGDRVQCEKHFPIGCTRTTVEGAGTVTEIDEVDRRDNTRVLFDAHVADGDTFAWYIDPDKLSPLLPKTKAGTGWTFRIPADEPIDGKRVLKELADAGADYAVVAWGKRDDQRLCLVSQRLAERAKAVGVSLCEPAFVVTNFDRGYTCNGVAEGGTSNYCYVNTTTLAELEDYAKRVKAAETAKRPTTVRVNFGVAK